MSKLEESEYLKKLDEIEQNSKADPDSEQAGAAIGGTGGSQPFIKINGYGPFSTRELKSFTLDTSGDYPTCFIQIKINSGRFLSTAFPKDGDLMNIFIRSFKNEFKPVRLDFLITKVESFMSKDPEGDTIVLFIDGVVRIPKLYAEICEVSKEKTSYETLFDIATKLGLGFSSNEETAVFKDKMNWIAPYITYKDWIKNVVDHAYSDDFGFYDYWVDQYLTLNFINMNKMLSVVDDFNSREGLFRSAALNDFGIATNNVHHKAEIMLTNERGAKTTNYYFNKFSINNNAGLTNLLNGYSRHIFWYNKLDEKMWDWEVKPIITQGSADKKVTMLGRAGEDFWKEEKKYKYGGVQYSLPNDNCHAYWKHAKFQNFQNLKFSNKMRITLNLPNMNPNLYKGMIIPVVFLLTQDDDRIIHASKKEDKAKESGLSVDRFLSGNYLIKGIKYIWKPNDTSQDHVHSGTWEQEILITRREWTVPDKHPLTEKEILK